MFKIRILNGNSNIQIQIQFPEQNKNNRKVIGNFIMEPRTLKNYTLAFKKRVLTRLEENDNSIVKTAREFNIHRKNLQ